MIVARGLAHRPRCRSSSVESGSAVEAPLVRQVTGDDETQEKGVKGRHVRRGEADP